MPVLEILNLSKVGRSLWDRYGNADKARNAIELQEQIAAGLEVITASPWRIVLEPGNVCNLHCKACPTHESELTRGWLGPEEVERYLGELWPCLVQVNLFHWGEPLLNPRLPEIIETIHRRDVGTHVHSNVNRLPAGLAERVIDAGLDYLVASIDGVTEGVYSQYRAGGSSREALKNLERFIHIRNAKGASSPRIVWRLLAFPHNRHEIDEAQRLAGEIGVDDFTVGVGDLDGQEWTADGPRVSDGGAEPSPPYCTDAFEFPVVHWDGTLMPCCFASSPEFVWGDLKVSYWEEAFNTEPFRAARRFLRGDAAVVTACRGCFKLPRRLKQV